MDLSDRLLAEAEPLDGRERLGKIKAAGDAATTGLRYWRCLKFLDPAKPSRKPGRPPKVEWPPRMMRDADTA